MSKGPSNSSSVSETEIWRSLVLMMNSKTGIFVGSSHRWIPQGNRGISNTTLTRSSFLIDLDQKFGSPSAPPIQVHAVGGKLIVDSTFGPPPLQDPFKWGADVVMHSGEFHQNCSARRCPDYEWPSEQVSWWSHGSFGWRIGCEDHRRMETGNVYPNHRLW